MKPKKFKVLLYEPIHRAGMDILEEIAETLILTDLDENVILPLIEDVDGIIIRGFGRVSEAVIDAAPKLKVVGRHGVGVENIDVRTATKRGICVVNTPMANTFSVSEFCAGLILSAAKKIVAADRDLRDGDWSCRTVHTGMELYEKTAGFIGFGRIGRQTAQICRNGFGMRILYSDVKECPTSLAHKLGAKYLDKNSLLETADVVVALLPGVPETEKLIGAADFRRMKKTALFVNCGRGTTVDQAALVEALQEGSIAGAALDVYEIEPLPKKSPLIKMTNVVLTPHMAALTEDAYRNMALVALDIRRVLVGEKPQNWVNPW